MSKLIIHATNIHTGGGKSLLTACLVEGQAKQRVVALLDRRMKLPNEVGNEIEIRVVSPTILQRIIAELWLKMNVKSQDTVLCFGNLPPLFKLSGNTVVFVQNRYLIDEVRLDKFPLKTRVRLWIERLWLSTRKANVDEFVVQTPSMKRLLEVRTKKEIPVRILPFMNDCEDYTRTRPQQERKGGTTCDFVYVASGEPHKNHRQLIEAWCLLANEGITPSLKLTIDRTQFSGLCGWIDSAVERYRLNVENLGSLPYEQIRPLYERTAALIYPSNFESFGLPLIEARQVGLPVLASELDYVRDILDPEQTFDPESAVSIARAVKRFLAINEPHLPLQDAAGFLKHILERAV